VLVRVRPGAHPDMLSTSTSKTVILVVPRGAGRLAGGVSSGPLTRTGVPIGLRHDSTLQVPENQVVTDDATVCLYR
jgi:hypothetical protein